MNKLIGGLLLLLPAIALADPRAVVREEDGSPSLRARILKFGNGTLTNNGDGSVSVAGGVSNTSELQSGTTFYVSSGTVQTELNIPNNGTLNIVGNSGKLSFVGAAVVNLQNAPGDSVLTVGGTGTGFLLSAASSEIRFGSSNQVVLKRTGTAELTVFTDNGTGGGYLLMAPLSRTKAQLDTITPPIAGQLYYCSDCTTDGVVVSTGTTIAAFGRISARSTKPN